MVTFLKKCPNCGKRFEVELTGETMKKSEELIPEKGEVVPPTVVAGGIPIAAASTLSNNPPEVKREIVLQEKEDITDTFKCKHCGHEWTENRVKISEDAIAGADSDI